MALQTDDPSTTTAGSAAAIPGRETEEQRKEREAAAERQRIAAVLANPTVTLPDYGEVNLLLAFPLTVGDWKNLGKQGVTPQALSPEHNPSVEIIASFVLYVLRKATDGAVDVRHLDALPMKQLGALGNKLAAISRAEELDIPFSMPATRSVDGTGGPPTT